MAQLGIRHLAVGERLPPVPLGRLVGDAIESVNCESLFCGRRILAIGVPGAFTPVCTREHVPSFVKEADRLKRSGFDMIMCIAPNDPWVLDVWSKALDPEGRLVFVSDGNLELARSLGVVRSDPLAFVGDRPSRYLMITQDAVIQHLRVEPTLAGLTCTRTTDTVVFE